MTPAQVTPGVLFLTGPTASGKSALALELAERFEAEIVGADSRQIYRDMPIGTAAPSAADRARVPHHLVGFLDPRERYSAARFVHDALAAIDAIHARGRRALVVGGTGFYVRALAGDVTLSPVRDEALRERLAREARIHPTEALAEWLRALAPSRAAAVPPGDAYRVTRALEIALAERYGTPPAPAYRGGTDRRRAYARSAFRTASSTWTSRLRHCRRASRRASTRCSPPACWARRNASGPMPSRPMPSAIARPWHICPAFRRRTSCVRT